MYKSIIFKSILFSVIVTQLSCFTERIDIDLNENNKKLVVTAWLTNLTGDQIVHLDYSVNYLNSITEDPAKGAIVTISNETDTYQLIEREDGRYYLDRNQKLAVGFDYTLSVTIDNQEYLAKETMRPCPNIENEYSLETEDEDGDPFTSIFFSFKDFKGEGDGYFARDYVKGSKRKDSLMNGSFINDEFIDGNYFEDVDVTQEGFSIGDTGIVELFSIGKSASEYLQDIEAEVYRGGLFDPPPVNVRTNISNGAIGYFIIGGAMRKEVIIK